MSEGLWRDRFLASGDILGQEIEVARERREVIREIGIRMALGARRLDVLGQVLLQGMALVGSGLAVGLLACWAGGRLIERFLFGVHPMDAVTFVVTVVLLALARRWAIGSTTRPPSSCRPRSAARPNWCECLGLPM